MTTQISGDIGVSQCAPNSISADDFQAALFQASLTANGYQKLPSGLIIQWGNEAFTSGTTINITFPIPFTVAMLSVSCMFAALSANGMTEQITSTSASAMSVHIAGPAGSGVLYWIAIGY